MKRLFYPTSERLNSSGVSFGIMLTEALEPIFSEAVNRGYSVRDLATIAISVITDFMCEHIATITPRD